MTITMMPEEKFNQETKRKCRLTPPNNFETFDVWGKANFVLWSNARYDFELIAELLRHIKSVHKTLYLLNSVNAQIKNAPENVFFDGTIKSLKYLVKNNYFQINNLPSTNEEEKYLIELLVKYSKRLDIMEVISDIEEPTLRAMLLEYPHLLDEVLKDNDLVGYLIGQALLKNGITDAKSLVEKVDNGLNTIEVDLNKNAPEPMKCKIIYLSLRILNGKLKLCKDLAEEFAKLSDNYIEEEKYTKGFFSATYAVFYGSDEWSKSKPTHLTGCETLYLDFQLLTLPNNHMSLIYDIFLKEETERIGKKYFREAYRPDGFIASLAIKMAVVIILFRTETFIPKDEKAEVSIFSGASMFSSLNYAVKETSNKEKPLELKQWFIDYYRNELDKRVAFIKLQVDNGIAIVRIRDIVRVIYLPVFESFRFFCSKVPSEVLGQIIKLFRNRTIGNEIKDDILINFVINIQKFVGAKKPTKKEISEEENYFKDAFILLISKIFENLVKKTIRSLELQSPIKSYYEKDDLFSDANIAIIELIVNFDLSKNDSFIGYLSHNLRLKIKTTSRIKKNDQYTALEHNFEEGFLENIPDENDFTKQLSNQENITKIKEYIDNLPEKQKEAIRKLYERNEQLSDSERKNKNRGLNKIREMMSMA